MKKILKQNQGFTLIEVMIAVVIVAIMAAIAYPSYTNYVRESRRADAYAALSSIALEQERYRTNNPLYAANLTDLNFNSNTPDSSDGFYQLTVLAADATSFTARATAQGTQTSDSECANIEITQNGPDISTSQKAKCWNK